MGSLAVQPPNGVTRNLTEVFLFLRNNALQSRFVALNFEVKTKTDQVNLIEASENEAISYNVNHITPNWVNIIDEVNYEITRVRGRVATLRELQQRQLSKLDFSEDAASNEAQKITELTDELTAMFGHCKRLIGLLENAETEHLHSLNKLKQNVAYISMYSLNALMQDFRSSQSTFLRHIDSRKSKLDTFLIKSNIVLHNSNSEETSFTDGETEELTIDQIQHLMQNEHLTKEREKEIIGISKSISELHNMFKDIATMIIDQGTILDRIDYNVEQSTTRIASAYNSVKKAEKYQRNRKMQLIVVLACFAIILMILIVLTKF